ncbi:hypothetical protein VCR14J2_390347 [Vibrio coralliirubri]|uniref:hypothetical protein n=1 Tax=Vibrio coralliirubri TaxID=1516159 RepID=UPI00063960C9|nr:hypothetical protein [Vibrio coralliirubri]CDU05706.1 hypothetical protein VCR14J2_390347 [Vibrio coralliirubri]
MCKKCLANIAELIEGGSVTLEAVGCKVEFPKMALIKEQSAIKYDAESKQLVISDLPESLIEDIENYLESKQTKSEEQTPPPSEPEPEAETPNVRTIVIQVS